MTQWYEIPLLSDPVLAQTFDPKTTVTSEPAAHREDNQQCDEWIADETSDP
jgi:hypothetical protein